MKTKKTKKTKKKTAPELSAEEQVLVAKWLATSNLGQPEPREFTPAAIERAYQYCAEVHYAEGLDIGDEYRMWLQDARRQDEFVREQWAKFKETGVPS